MFCLLDACLGCSQCWLACVFCLHHLLDAYLWWSCCVCMPWALGVLTSSFWRSGGWGDEQKSALVQGLHVFGSRMRGNTGLWPLEKYKSMGIWRAELDRHVFLPPPPHFLLLGLGTLSQMPSSCLFKHSIELSPRQFCVNSDFSFVLPLLLLRADQRLSLLNVNNLEESYLSFIMHFYICNERTSE